MSIEMTQSKFERTAKELYHKAGKEPVRIEFHGDRFFVFGSELSCLRLYYAYRGSPGIHFAKSGVYSSHFFRLETPSFHATQTFEKIFEKT